LTISCGPQIVTTVPVSSVIAICRVSPPRRRWMP